MSPTGSFTTLKEIGHCLLEFLQCTITSHAQNGDVLIRLGATSCLLNRILTTEVNEYILPWRSSALTIYEELMLSNGGEELMPYLLENMHHAYADLKIDVSPSNILFSLPPLCEFGLKETLFVEFLSVLILRDMFH
ncbi:unnamed protein product [Trichobilharzia regenti]|nr:unnamed protein product [Trichobilharzia regenti]